MWSQTAAKMGTSYTLSYTYKGSCAGWDRDGSVSIGTATQYTITGLKEFSPYTITITAFNGGWSSPPAVAVVNTSASGKMDDLIYSIEMDDSLPQQLPLHLLTASL
jgi:hypothetical protein